MNRYIELIVQYHGNLQRVLRGKNVIIDMINEKHAIIKTHELQIPYLQSIMEIEYMEESQPINEVMPVMNLNNMTSYEQKKLSLNGKGVMVGWIGTRMNIDYENYNKFDGTTRINYIYDGRREYNSSQINSIRRTRAMSKKGGRDSPMDTVVGNDGIAPESEIILVNLPEEKVYTADIIRAMNFIIKKIHHTQTPIVVYLPFDISKIDTGKSIDGYGNLTQKIINNMTRYGKVAIVSSIEGENQKLDLNRGPIFSTCAPLTVGSLCVLMEWGIIRGNNPELYGELLRTYYIKSMLPLLKKELSYTRDLRENSLDDFLKLLIPVDSKEEFRGLNIPYELVPDDAVIDVMVVCNNTNIHTEISDNHNVMTYPLIFPYSGMRGTVGEIKKVFNVSPGKAATGFLAYILGNEPLGITPTSFQFASILKTPKEFKGINTLIGIIDTGIDYTNPVFIDDKGETRITSIWDQTIGSDSPYGYGTVYNQEIINTALKSPDPFKVVPHQDEWGVGTILAGIAAGSGESGGTVYEGMATEAELAVVKLKPATPAMQEIYNGKYNPLGFSSLDVALAVQYLVNLAMELEKPISICVALGTNLGSHDGTNILDSIMVRYGHNQGVSIIHSAGDEANKSHHASGNLKEEIYQKVKLIIPKGQPGFMLEVWARFGDRLEVSLTPPPVESKVQPTIVLNKAQMYQLGDSSFIWSQGSKLDIDTGCEVFRFRLGNPLDGEWTIGVRGLTVIDGWYNIWIPKTGMILPQTVLLPASPFTTIYNSGSATGLITTACYDKSSLSACTSSGRGFTRDDRVKPDFMVGGVNIPGPLPNNKFGVITGTAPSSAITTGVCSLIYENQMIRGEVLSNTPIMRAVLVDNLKREPTVSYPDPSRGYGLLDINAIVY